MHSQIIKCLFLTVVCTVVSSCWKENRSVTILPNGDINIISNISVLENSPGGRIESAVNEYVRALENAGWKVKSEVFLEENKTRIFLMGNISYVKRSVTVGSQKLYDITMVRPHIYIMYIYLPYSNAIGEKQLNVTFLNPRKNGVSAKITSPNGDELVGVTRSSAKEDFMVRLDKKLIK